MTQSQPDAADLSELNRLVDTVATLRAPDGCPWDAEQTHESLVRYLIEETFEVVHAIETADDEELVEELGDLLYQIVFHAGIAQERGAFTLSDVAQRVTEKMISRHPHVFREGQVGVEVGAEVSSGASAPDIDTVISNWEAIKRAEKSDRTSRLDGVPRAMPALLLADKVFGKARDLPQVTEGLDASVLGDISDEAALGAHLFEMIYAAKAQGLDAERALRLRLAQFMDDIQDVEKTQ